MSNLAHSNEHFESREKKQVLGGVSKRNDLHPIDETEEFHDPFSDLNLFLSKKIRQELDKNENSSKKWSHKIQDELLSAILPEFKEIFPKYRLGGAALKKIWDKVSYYYTTVKSKRGAITPEGKLNLPFMIRENLKAEKTLPANLPPYANAHQLAMKMSECIATLEGSRPDLTDLTKTIWAVQKHLIQDLPSREAKSPYEEYDLTDKIIVKTLLEVTAKHAHFSLEELATEIRKRLEAYQKLTKIAKKNHLLSIVSASLAKMQKLSNHFALRAFIHRQLCMIQSEETLSYDANRVEAVQRILAVYPIIIELPSVGEDLLKRVIHFIYDQMNGNDLETCPVADQSIYVFVNAEMHLFQHLPFHLIESSILESYAYAKDLPAMDLSLVEAHIWAVIDENEQILDHTPADILSLIEQELANIAIDQPGQPFRRTVQGAMQFMKKAMELDQRLIEKKVQHWAIQNDMICRWIHFDAEAPLLKLVKSLFKEGTSHAVSVDKALKAALLTYPELEPFQAQLKVRLWILYKFMWYSACAPAKTSSFERFVAYHKLAQKDLTAYLERALPFSPAM